MSFLTSHSPIEGAAIGQVAIDAPAAIAAKAAQARTAFSVWRATPAPRRGELVRLWGEVLRARKEELAQLVTLECGKILSEARGEVQEMIDICDFAVGLSRQLYGLTIASERPEHHLIERWHPLGVVGVISAFNFPVAVFAWNAALALVCGDSVLWKPSDKTPLCAQKTFEIFEEARALFGGAPDGLVAVIQGGAAAGEAVVDASDLISATGSTRMGKAVAARAALSLKRTLLELGGNAAMIVAPSADLDMAVRAVCFSAVGTAGQRCTTLRRLLVHESIAADVVSRLKRAYASLPIGDPREDGVLVGPLIDADALHRMRQALTRAEADGGIVAGGAPVERAGAYARAALVEMPAQTDIVREETFAPILYVMRYKTFEDAIAMLRDVPQGLSSSLFSNDLRETELFLSATGSDCGIANINAGPSGAEIGGAFGGEKETGGGRESGSDAWKAYMRRQTQTVNYGRTLPLAQGVSFDVGG